MKLYEIIYMKGYDLSLYTKNEARVVDKDNISLVKDT